MIDMQTIVRKPHNFKKYLRGILTVPFLVLFFVMVISCGSNKQDLVDKDFHLIENQLSLAVRIADSNMMEGNNALVIPRSISPDGKLILVGSDDWCSGFFAGTLWYMYEYTNDSKWEKAARKYTDILEPERKNKGTHDLGFMMYCSYGNGLRLSHDTAYKSILIQTAENLKSRYSPKLKVIRSWDFGEDVWQYPVIIDNMMNLELLFWAAKETKDTSFYNVAVNHAKTTMKHHFRDDYSTYHVVDYDTVTGGVRQKMTHQGYSDSSSWARGQAWALYGYVMCYKETKERAFLDQATHIANFLFKHPNMPSDYVPYWDFDSPKIPDEHRDASAAAIIASAMYDLYVVDGANNQAYKDYADKIMNSLSTNYMAPKDGLYGFILGHSTGSMPHNSEVDVPLSYADYYFMEALLRKRKIEDKI